MRVSGERQRNSRNASPEKRASAMNAGSPDSSSTTTAQGEKWNSRLPEVTSEIAFCASPKVRITRLNGPAGGLAARARELVVELRVLEVRKLQGQRLLQDHHIHALAQLRPQQRLAQRQAALCRGHHRHQHPLEHHKVQDPMRIAIADPDGGHDGIDQLRCHPEDAAGNYAGDDRQHGQGQGEPAAGAQHQRQRLAAVAKDAKEARQRGVHGARCRGRGWLVLAKGFLIGSVSDNHLTVAKCASWP